ncbi:ABC transporter permease [Companilactobacillus huachuanensis]|uniref:ABC transporter permease n=1 Tax=Companilactobacillus huachuanensis TaxID=2559914 RepID=A0ABW1RLC6_9LACO|nr:ABC-2 family transporter protein [Companilactobacillus huachuanensis]
MLVKNNIKAQFEYNISTYLLILGQFIAQFTFILGFFFLFKSLGSIRGYVFSQALLVYALVNISYTCAEIIGKGINNLSELIRRGNLDIYLMRPQPLLLQVMGSGVEISRIGRLITSISLLALAIIRSSIQWDSFRIIAMFIIPLGGIILFLGLYILFGSLTFFTVNSINISILLMGSGSDCLHYPVDVMNKTVKTILTYIFPFALINYYPFLYIFGKSTVSSLVFVPFLSIGFLSIILQFWKYGAIHYSSTGS